MRYRLDRLPIQLPAATATLAHALDESGDDLLRVLTARRARCNDVRIDGETVECSEIAPDGVTLRWAGAVGSYRVTGDLLHQLRRWTGLGRKDFFHALYESPTTLRARIDGALDERNASWGGFFVRLEEDRVRALLPRDYRPLDHVETATAFHDECRRWRDRGVDVRIDSCEEVCGDLFLTACAPSLAAEVRAGDWLYAGISLSNSESSSASTEVRPRIYRAICANGAIAQEAEAEGFEIEKLPAKSPTAEPSAPPVPPLVCFREKLAAAFELAFRPERVEREAAVDRGAAETTLSSPFEHLQHLVASDLLDADERDAAQRLFADGNEASLFGLANAITAAAHGRRALDLRRAYALERLGAEIARGDHGPPVGAPVFA